MTGRDAVPTTATGSVDNMKMVCHLDVVIAAGRPLRNFGGTFLVESYVPKCHQKLRE